MEQVARVPPRGRGVAVCAAVVAAGMLLPGLVPAPTAAAAEAGGPEFLPGWAHRREVTVEHQGGGLQDFQVLVVFDTEAAVAAGTMRADCADVRLTAGDGVSLLPHWLESGCGTPATRVWVKADLGAGNTTLHLYHGKSDAGSASSPHATFLADLIHAAAGDCTDYPRCQDMTEEGARAVRGYDANLCEAYVDRLAWESVCDLQPPYEPGDSGRSHFFQRFRFLLVADAEGSWSFATDSDDGSELRRTVADGGPGGDSSVVAAWYYGHGWCACTDHQGTLSLAPGEGAWFDYVMAEWEGQEAAVLYVARPGTGFATATADNFPGMLFARRYAETEPVASVGPESAPCPGPAALAVAGDAAALASGAFTGTGTAADPLILDGAVYRGAPQGIALTGLTLHVVLRNLTLEDHGVGLCVAAAAHVTLERSLVRGNAVGISAGAGASVTVGDSDLVANGLAIRAAPGAGVDAQGNFWGSLAGPAPPGSAAAGANGVTAGVAVGPIRAESALAAPPGGIAVWLDAYAGLGGFLRSNVTLGAFRVGASASLTASVDGGAALPVDGFSLVVAGDGPHTIQLHADGVLARELHIHIDAHAPWVQVTATGRHGLLDGDLALGIGGCIALTAADATSGIDEALGIHWTLDGDGSAYSGPRCAPLGGSLSEGGHTMCRAAADHAGNRGARGEPAGSLGIPPLQAACHRNWANFTVDLTPPQVALARPAPGTLSAGKAYVHHGTALAPLLEALEQAPLPPDAGSALDGLGRRAVLAGRVPVVVEASDNLGLARVQLLVDGSVVGERTQAPWEFTLDTSGSRAGEAVLSAIAWDAAGNPSTPASQEVLLLPVPATATDLLPPFEGP